MSKNDDELNEFIDEVTDGAYNLPCVEVIFKLVKRMQPWPMVDDSRRENQENSGWTSCRRDQDLHRR